MILFGWKSFSGPCPSSFFFNETPRFGSRLCSRLQARKTPICWTLYIELFSATGRNGAPCFGSRLCFWLEERKAPNLLDLLDRTSLSRWAWKKVYLRGPTDEALSLSDKSQCFIKKFKNIGDWRNPKKYGDVSHMPSLESSRVDCYTLSLEIKQLDDGRSPQ